LYLIRDRLGIKPLFYGRASGGFYFASELKGLVAAGITFELDEASVASFLRFGYVPTPHSIYRGVAKVRPGEVVSFDASGAVKQRSYWSIEHVAREGLRHPFSGSEAQAEEVLHELLANAVSTNMISDVPIGAFLSGGIDSSTVVALMTAAKRGPVRTFSIGFPDLGYDESVHARSVAAHLGTTHEDLMVTAAEALAVVPQLPEIYDEPFADSSQIPTYAISQMTRAHVTVALSGDGGDELFAGYNRYALTAGRLGGFRRLPRSLRRVAAAALHAIPHGAADVLARVIPSSLRPTQPVEKLKKFADVLGLDGDAVYLRLVSQCTNPSGLTHGREEHPVHMPCAEEVPKGMELERMQLFDMATYLPDDILQ